MSEVGLDRADPGHDERPQSPSNSAPALAAEPPAEDPSRATSVAPPDDATLPAPTAASTEPTAESAAGPAPEVDVEASIEAGSDQAGAPTATVANEPTAASAPAAEGEAATAEQPVGDTRLDPEPATAPAQPEAPRGSELAPTGEKPHTGAGEQGTGPAQALLETAPAAIPGPALEHVNAQLAAITAALEPLGQLEQLRSSVAELTRLRSRDSDLIDRLHGDNTRLRAGELATATTPLLHGLVRLHDQMSSIAAGDQHSVAGMLRTQLLQLLEVAAGVTSYEPKQGDPFDPSRHTGAARGVTTDPSLDNTVGRRIRPGFARADGSVLRVAEVEVLRHAPVPSTSTDQKEPQ